MRAHDLWLLGRTYSPELVDQFPESKYIILSKHYDNYRYLVLADIMKYKDQIPSYMFRFVAKYGCVLMIGNLVLDYCASIVLRSLTDKSFLDYGATKGVFYGIGRLDNSFSFGAPILVVEGPADCDVARFIYPNVMATKTSTVSMAQSMVLAALTSKVLLLLDNDEAGKHGSFIAKTRLEKYGVNVVIVNHPSGIKDIATILDLRVKGDDRYRALYPEYKEKIKFGLSCLG